MKRVPLVHTNKPTARRARTRRAARPLALLCAAGLLIAGGFVYAARQHYGALKLGYLSEEMRREKAKLVEEQSRLLVAREQAASPARLESSARAIGMQPAAPSQINFRQEPPASPARRDRRAVPAAAVSVQPVRIATR